MARFDQLFKNPEPAPDDNEIINSPRNALIDSTLKQASNTFDPSGSINKLLDYFRETKGSQKQFEHDLPEQMGLAGMGSTRAVEELGPIAGKAANKAASLIKDLSPEAEHIKNLELIQDLVKSQRASPARSVFGEHNLNSGWNSDRKNKIVDMPIEDFLRMAKRINSPYEFKMGPIKEALEAGKTLETNPALWYDIHPKTGQARVTGHEGRHRANVLRDMGYTHIPVTQRADFYWDAQMDPNAYTYRKMKWPENITTQNGEVIKMPVSREDAAKPYESIWNKYPLLDRGGFKNVYSNENTDKVIKKFRPDEYNSEDLIPAAIQEQLNFNKMDTLNPNTKTYKTSDNIYQIQDKNTPMSKVTKNIADWENHENILNYMLKKRGLVPSDLHPDNYGVDTTNKLKVFDTGTFGKIKQIDNNDMSKLDETFKTLPMDKDFLNELFKLKAGK